MCKRFLLLALVLAPGLCLTAQKKQPILPPSKAPAIPPASIPSMPAAPKPGPRPYKEIVTAKAVTDTGLFQVHKVDDKFYFEIADSLLTRDILIVNRIAKAAADGRGQMMGYGGDQINETVVRFEKGPNNRLFLKTISYSERSADTSVNGMYRSVINSNLQPITASFDVKAYRYTDSTNKKVRSTVIDMTEYINGDNDVLFFDGTVKGNLKLTVYQPDKSYIQEVRSFPSNIEIKTVKTYMKALTPPPYGPGGAAPATYELNSSIVLLPAVPMQPRYFDNRVGYFITGYTDFDANPQGIKKVSMITRWRLEPKPEDMEKYKRGELVEPKKPIIFYIDPATPKKWVPYLIQGVNDWQVAFEQAGFKNAVIAKEAPVNDPEWSLDDASHSAIVYKPSDIPNASGPHVHDPRSGEILETHVNWYHNVMELLRNWYMIQAANVDPRSRKMSFDDSLMGQLIRFVSSHEVGHTLGLRHNFGASSTVPVENLRNKAWVEKYGHTPSIMDYARFNYVAQPEDYIGEAGIFPRINDYDKWAIEWGYRLFPDKKPGKQEDTFLNQWIIERVSKNKRLWFGDGEWRKDDPRCQTEDLGDNAMKAGAYGIKNLQRILPKLGEWTKEANEDYGNLNSMYKELTGQLFRYLVHVAKNIGGRMTDDKSVEQPGVVYQYTPKATQKEAMQFLNEQLFKTPSWLIEKKYTGLLSADPVSTIGGLQNALLGRLLSAGLMDQLLDAEAVAGNATYTVPDLLSDLKKGVWTELPLHQPITMYRRNLQKMYTEKLIAMIAGTNASQGAVTMTAAGSDPAKMNDVLSLVKHHAKTLVAEIRAALPAIADVRTKMHLQDVLDRLTTALDPKK